MTCGILIKIIVLYVAISNSKFYKFMSVIYLFKRQIKWYINLMQIFIDVIVDRIYFMVSHLRFSLAEDSQCNHLLYSPIYSNRVEPKICLGEVS
jgi:hypothetical protein